jgi:hypothetical protein
MRGAISTLPITPSWPGTQLIKEHRDNFAFYLYLASSTKRPLHYCCNMWVLMKFFFLRPTFRISPIRFKCISLSICLRKKAFWVELNRILKIACYIWRKSLVLQYIFMYAPWKALLNHLRSPCHLAGARRIYSALCIPRSRMGDLRPMKTWDPPQFWDINNTAL